MPPRAPSVRSYDKWPLPHIGNMWQRPLVKLDTNSLVITAAFENYSDVFFGSKPTCLYPLRSAPSFMQYQAGEFGSGMPSPQRSCRG